MSWREVLRLCWCFNQQNAEGGCQRHSHTKHRNGRKSSLLVEGASFRDQAFLL